MSSSIYYDSLCFDDVLLRPRQSRVKSRSHIDVSTKLATNEQRQIHLKKPLISSPMDTVTDSEMAIHMALNGGLGIIHRFMSLEDQIAEVARVKRYVNYIFYHPYTVTPETTIREAIAITRNNGVTTLCVASPSCNMSRGIPTDPRYINLPNICGIITRRDMQAFIDKLDRLSHPGLLSQPSSLSVSGASNPNDLQLDSFLDLDIPVTEIMTPYSELCVLKTPYKTASEIEADPEYLSTMMKMADYIMKSQRVEKVPIIYAYYHHDYEYGSVEPDLVATTKLIGLITRRSVEFYLHRRQLACLDKQGRLCVGVAIGIKPGLEQRAKKLVNAGADLLCVDVANGHNIHTVDAVKKLRAMFPYTVIMAGNIVTAEGYYYLAEAGADCVRVGIGNGSICTTRLETGVGFGQFSAVQEIYQASRTISNPVMRPIIISDGGSLGKTGNKMKALAAGADAVMLGRSLASCEESPGSIIIKNGKRMKYYRGMASTMASLSNQEKQQSNASSGQPMGKRSKTQDVRASEGVDGLIEVQCSVKEKLETIVAGIKSGMSYLDVYSMEELDMARSNHEIKWGRCTAIGMSETGTRVHKL